MDATSAPTIKTPSNVAAFVNVSNRCCIVVTSDTPSLYAYPSCFHLKITIATVANIHISAPTGLPCCAMLPAKAPKIVGIKEANRESPTAAKDPINPTFIPFTVSLALYCSSSSIARSIPVIIVLKKLLVLKN